jgi:hypothetical protein
MKRRLFTLCSALSLSLCATACALWVRSYWAEDEIRWVRITRGPAAAAAEDAMDYYTVASGAGGFAFAGWRGVDSPQWRYELVREEGLTRLSYGSPTYAGMRTQPPGDGLPARLGFDWSYATGPNSRSSRQSWSLVSPWWVPCAASAVLPAFRLVQHARARRRDRRIRGNLCADCGYDLRSSPGRCPECGAAVPANAQAGAGPEREQS